MTRLCLFIYSGISLIPKTHPMKQFSTSGIWHLLKQTGAGFRRDKVLKLSASLAYYAAFSLGTMLLVILFVSNVFWRKQPVKVVRHLLALPRLLLHTKPWEPALLQVVDGPKRCSQIGKWKYVASHKVPCFCTRRNTFSSKGC